MTPKTLELIEEYKDQAYHIAVKSTIIATLLKDTAGAKMFAECAKELIIANYHKNPRTINVLS